ncbi:MAG: gamma-glutamyltransferase, partial [Tepidisphaeraceae bacterium]
MRLLTKTLILVLLPAIVRAGDARGVHGMVATVHPIATDAAVDVLRRGGNAIDAAVKAALVLGVVDGHNSGIGGGCFMLVRTSDGKIYALDGRETAPAASSRDMFVRDGKPDTNLSQSGALAIGVPGSLAVYDYAITHFGAKSLAESLVAAADIAERGFPLDHDYARVLAEKAPALARFEASRAALLKPDLSPLAEGEILKQPDLARTYRSIAIEGIDWFYRGDFARRLAGWMKQNGGLITETDLATYEVKLREPLVTTYRGCTIVGFPPPSSGGVHVAQILNILEQFDLAAMEKNNPADRVHVMAEAMKLAFADRAYWLGDPDFAPVPRGLVNLGYAAQLASTIRMDSAAPDVQHGTPPGAMTDLFGPKHTTHIAVADDKGNFVAITATLNLDFGSKVIIPGTGVIMNNQMDDFSIQAGVENYFKLVGSEANAVAPGKRPLSSMSPTIVLKDGKPVMTLGAAGGPRIISQVVLVLTNLIDLRVELGAALSRPRFHHQWSPNELWIENTFDESVLRQLESRGHKVAIKKPEGATQAIV